MTVVGMSWTDEVFITAKRHIALEASLFPGLKSARDLIAAIPGGVAAFPRPSIFADILRLISEKALWFSGISGKSFLRG